MTMRKTDGHLAHAMPAEPVLIRLLAYWHELRGERRAPMRRDLDPAEIAYCLDRIALVEVLDDGDLRCLLAGQQLVAALGRNAANLLGSQVLARRHRPDIWAVYDEAIALCEPRSGHSSIRLPDGTNVPYSRLLLPLLDTDESVRWLLAAYELRWPVTRRPSLLGRIGPNFLSGIRRGAMTFGQTLDSVVGAVVAGAGRRRA